MRSSPKGSNQPAVARYSAFMKCFRMQWTPMRRFAAREHSLAQLASLIFRESLVSFSSRSLPRSHARCAVISEGDWPPCSPSDFIAAGGGVLRDISPPPRWPACLDHGEGGFPVVCMGPVVSVVWLLFSFVSQISGVYLRFVLLCLQNIS